MKENKLTSYFTGQDTSGADRDGRNFTCDLQHSMTNPPCIVVKGFPSVQAFLAWFNISAPQPLICPTEQGRSIRLLHDCIIICGFADLDEMLHWFGGDDFQRPTVPPLPQNKEHR